MQVSEILKLDLKQINNVACTNVIEDVYIGDLLSFVMANGTDGSLWLTVQKHLNKATSLDIPLFISEKSAYALAKELISLGL